MGGVIKYGPAHITDLVRPRLKLPEKQRVNFHLTNVR